MLIFRYIPSFLPKPINANYYPARMCRGKVIDRVVVVVVVVVVVDTKITKSGDVRT